MRQLRSNKILGVAMTDQGFLVAEVVGSGSAREVRRSAEFKFPQGKTLADLPALGKPFGQFLKQKGFSAKHLVMGVPASWVMVKPKEVPPADVATAASILRLQAESDFSSELKELVFDYAGETDRLNARTVLVMALPKERLTQITDLAIAARLSLEAVVPSVVALAVVCKTLVAPEGLVIYVGPRTVEWTFHNSRGLQRIRSAVLVGSAASAPNEGDADAANRASVQDRPVAQELAAELRRTLVSLPQNGTPASARKLVFWDGAGLNSADRDLISERLGLPFNSRVLTDLGVTSTDPEGGRFVPAVAVALAAGVDPGLPVDFLDPRLAPPKQGINRRVVSWIAFAAALLILGIGWFVYDTESKAAVLSDQNKQYDKAKPEIARANAASSKLKFANAAYSTNPKLVYLLRAITDAYPSNNGNAWTTNLEIQLVPEPSAGARPADIAKGPPPGSYTGTLTGKATAVEEAKSVVDKMKSSGHFKDVKGPELNINARTHEVTFAVSFIYVPTE